MSNQIDAWKGEFGDAYHARNQSNDRRPLWDQIWNLPAGTRMFPFPMDILEIGAGMGANLKAILRLYRSIGLEPRLWLLEPNEKARKAIPLDYSVIYGEAEKIMAKDAIVDLAFTYGVLIHLPDPLLAMREMYRVSRRYVICAEYFSPRREAISYRDNVPLFKDDYGSLWMDNFDVKLLGYGFCWKRITGLDNITWWLFEKITAPGA